MVEKTAAFSIDGQPMTLMQYTTVAVCFLMNILDGMDVLVISYCAPAIAKSWNVSPEALGAVFSAGLAGMTLGAMLLAPIADKIGRKRMILLSGLLMGVSIFATAYAPNVTLLIVLRFASGIGIGSMLASTTALTSEYTPNKSRDFWVSFVISGYPVGAVLAGFIAAQVIPESGWQTMFKIAGIASLITIPLIMWFMVESVSFYLKTQPINALEKANMILLKLNQPTLKKLPLKEKKSAAIPIRQLLSSEYRTSTLQLWFALFFAFGCLYFLLSWIPKLAESAGLSEELAIYAGTVFNIGAWFGIITQGYFSTRFGLKKTIAVFFFASALLMILFQYVLGTSILLVVFGFLGFGVQGGFVGLYAVAARMYPTAFKTSGVGWAIGAGRLGGVIGPAFGGILIGYGFSLAHNFMIFAIPCLLAGVMAWFIVSKKIS